MKNIIAATALFFICLQMSVLAQSTITETAFASQHGIFIKLETDYPHIDVNAVPEYEISRRVAGEKNFKKIATVKVPQSYEAFVANLKNAADVNPEPLLMKEIPAERLWKKFTAGGYDSLEESRNAIFLQLALGIKYFDATAEKNVLYEYEVVKKAAQENTFITNSVSFPLKPEKYNAGLHKVKETALSVSLNYICKGDAPALVRLYREENYSGNFLPVRAKRIRMIKNDTISFAIYDTVVKVNSVYRYYILPLDYYGNYGVVSDTITAIASSLQYAGNIDRMDAISLGNEGTAIRWKLSDPGNFNSVAVYRTDNFDSTLVKIGMASAADTQYVDRTAEPMKIYFYALQPLTRNGSSLPMSAKITAMFTPKSQPLAPYITNIDAKENKITLSIKSNDPQTRGYRIYRKTNADSSYIAVSGLVKVTDDITVFTDTLAQTAGTVYNYVARAENKAYVLSGISNTVRILSDKKTALVSPGVPHVEIINNRAVVQWKNALENDGFVSCTLYRKDAAGKEQILQKNISADISNYIDTTSRPGKTYQYGISYQDKYGNTSAIAYAKAVTLESAVFGPVNVYAAANENNLIVTWDTAQQNAAAYKIYTLKSDKAVLLAEVKADVNSYTLKNVNQGESYSIYITSIDREKVESMPGKTVVAYIK